MAVDKTIFGSKIIRADEDLICLDPTEQRAWAQELTISQYRRLDNDLEAEIRRLTELKQAIVETRRELKNAALGTSFRAVEEF